MADPRTIVFTDACAPPLEAGAYDITVVQTVSPGTEPPESYINVRRFYVRGERFSLAPGEVIAVFPPNGSNGEYGEVLPHVVLDRRTLPWERSPGGLDATWLAILVFQEEEAPPVQVRRVADLKPGALPPGMISYAVELEPGESEADPCRTIDVSGELFARIAPQSGDLKWLAHVRSVQGAAKADHHESEAVSRSIVVGNRLPALNSACVCHLVSLEGLAAHLPVRDNPVPNPGGFRLVSLTSWSFTSADAPRTFSSYFSAPEMAGPLHRRHLPGEGIAARALDLGYVPLEHRSRFGDRTISWYRGPLVPLETKPIVAEPRDGTVIRSADEAVRYDPSTGVLDVTYAAAWALGRLLALADVSFSGALAAWKRAGSQKTVHHLARRLVAGRFAALAGKDNDGTTGGLLASLATSLVPASAALARNTDGPPLLGSGSVFHGLHRVGAAELRAIHADTVVPADLGAWLRRLVSLTGVPTTYLVPDPSLLPPESLRFFILDRNWINALLEGATSIGRATSFEAKRDDALAAALYAAASPPERASGFVLNSPVVSGWPGLEVSAFDEDGALIGARPVNSSLAEPARPSSTALVVQAGDGARFPLTDAPHYVEVEVRPAPEVARCTAVSGDTLRLERTARRDLRADDELEAGLTATRLAAVSGDSVTVSDSDGGRFPAPPFDVTIRRPAELVRCTEIVDDRLIVTRRAGARELLAGDAVALAAPRLRLERIGPTSLLFLTVGKLAEVHIHEPGEGLHFGFQDGQKQLRAAGGEKPGALLDGQPVLLAGRVTAWRTIAFDALAEAIHTTGGAAVENQGRFTSAELALQLIEGVQSVRFMVGGA